MRQIRSKTKHGDRQNSDDSDEVFDIFDGRWPEIRSEVGRNFQRLTEQDLRRVDQNHEALVAVFRERYGYSEVEAQREWETFMDMYGASKRPSRNENQNKRR
jgi:hypothetical protein